MGTCSDTKASDRPLGSQACRPLPALHHKLRFVATLLLVPNAPILACRVKLLYTRQHVFKLEKKKKLVSKHNLFCVNSRRFFFFSEMHQKTVRALLLEIQVDSKGSLIRNLALGKSERNKDQMKSSPSITGLR